jgi:hypothetical protein
MPKTYSLFISHCWDYADDYVRLIDLLDDAANFSYKNYSVPKMDPLHANNEAKLKEDLERQIRPTSIVIILAGMYAHHSHWVGIEMDIAKRRGKPMIGIKPWGAERTPVDVQIAVRELVSWNTSSIVNAIKTHSLS